MSRAIELTDEWKDVYEAAEMLRAKGISVSPQKIYHHALNSRIKTGRDGKRVTVRLSDLEKMPIVVNLGFLVSLVNSQGRS